MHRSSTPPSGSPQPSQCVRFGSMLPAAAHPARSSATAAAIALHAGLWPAQAARWHAAPQ
jgi:hypothetical protein